jgi:hypothetical protein
MMTLKRGCGLTFTGENWKLAGDTKWERAPLYIPNASHQEQFMGTRLIKNKTYAVFKCLNDDFLAQPVNICELPVSKDDYAILSIDGLEKKDEEVTP